MSRDQYVMGPGRGRRAPKPAPKPVEPAPVSELLFEWRPTTFVQLANGRTVVENPNWCGICHQRRHADTPHHDFLPDRAYPLLADRLGWPSPSLEPLL